MKRVLPRHEARFRDIQIFERDIIELCRAMSEQGRKAVLKLDDWKLDAIEELPELAKHQPVAKELTIRSYPPDKSGGWWGIADLRLIVDDGFAFFSADEATVGALGICAHVEKICAAAKVQDKKWKDEKWDTVVLRPRPISIKLATAIDHATVADLPQTIVTSEQAVSPPTKEDAKPPEMVENTSPTPIAQNIFTGPSIHHHGPGPISQNIAGHDQNIATGQGRISLNKPERETGWVTKEVVKKIIAVAGTIIAGLVIWYLEKKGVSTTRP